MKRAKPNKNIHLISYHYAATFKCGKRVDEFVDRNEDWAEFNRIRTTTIKEATCRDCLEWAFNNKKKELQEIAKKLDWEIFA